MPTLTDPERNLAGNDPLPLRPFRALFSHVSDIVTILEPDGSWRTTSPAGTRLLGWPEGLDPGPDGILGLVHPDDREPVTRALVEVRAGTRDPEVPELFRVRAADGTWHTLETRAVDLTDDPHVGGIVLTSRDVTEERAARSQVALFARMLESTDDLVLICDLEGTVRYANEAARRRIGIDVGEPARADLAAVLEPGSLQRILHEAGDRLRDEGTWTSELVGVTRSATPRTFRVTAQRHRDFADGEEFVSVVAHDITDLKRSQELLAHLATHDTLTGLANRSLFQELGEQALARADRQGTTVAVLFVDLDHFKPVNDLHGHAAGDALLRQVADRLRGSLRRGDVVARFGGDEFVVLCEHPTGQPEMRDLARRLIAALSAPFDLASTPGEATTSVVVGASVGVAMGAGARVTIDTLIRDADAALYRAKEGGRSRAVVFGTDD